MVPFAAKAKLGDNATSRMHSTKRMTASPFFAVIRSNPVAPHHKLWMLAKFFLSGSDLTTAKSKNITN
jgi:hypothetical protein